MIKRFNKQQRYNSLYKSGLIKMNQEFDCLEFIRSMRKLKLMAKVILDENKQILADFASQKILDRNERVSKISQYNELLFHKD